MQIQISKKNREKKMNLNGMEEEEEVRMIRRPLMEVGSFGGEKRKEFLERESSYVLLKLQRDFPELLKL